MGEHAWNIVKIDNNYYHVDVTWDDPLGDATLRYDYFLISDKRISKDHKWNDSEYGTNMFGEDEREIPLCSYDFERKLSEDDFIDEDVTNENSNNISFDDDERVIDGISYNVDEIIDLAVAELNIPEQVGICVTVSSPEYNAELQEYIIWIEFYENETDLDNGDVKASASWCIESKQFYTRFSEFENY